MSKLNKLRLASLALAGLGAVASGNAVAASMTVDSNGGIEVFELDDTNYWFKLGGRLHLLNAWYEGGQTERSKFPDGSRIQRAKISLKGGVGNNWVYKLDVGFIDAATNIASNFGNAVFQEAFIAYNGCERFWIALGQISVPFSLEGWAASDESPFIGTSLPVSAFSPSYGIGLYAEWHSDMFTAAGAVYHPGAGERQTGDVLSTAPATIAGAGPAGSDPGSEPVGAGIRVTFSPVHNDHTVYHFGVSYRYEGLQDRANNFNYTALPEIASRQAPVIFTNIPPNSVESHYVIGGEVAGRWGPFQVAAEFFRATVQREGNYFNLNDPRNPPGDLHYHGYYVMASWVVTGETKDYSFPSGTFGRVHPKSSKGAWEVLARHSYVRLVDLAEIKNLPVPWVTPNASAPGAAAANGILAANLPSNSVNDFVGNSHSTTVGVTYWANDNVRFLLNYSRMKMPEIRNPSRTGDIDINAVGLAAQVDW